MPVLYVSAPAVGQGTFIGTGDRVWWVTQYILRISVLQHVQ